MWHLISVQTQAVISVPHLSNTTWSFVTCGKDQVEHDSTIALRDKVESLDISGDYWELLRLQHRDEVAEKVITVRDENAIRRFMLRWTGHSKNNETLFNNPARIEEILKTVLSLCRDKAWFSKS